MNTTSLLLSMVFGTAGMGFVMYAKNAGRAVPAIAGVGLMVLPYFISDVLWMTVICSVLIVAPFYFRDT